MRRFSKLFVVFVILLSGMLLAPYAVFPSERFGWQALISTYEPEADLSVTKSDSPDPVLQGETLIYVVNVTNAGPDDATGVTVTDILPVGVALGSATPGQGSCSPTGSGVSCDLGTVSTGSPVAITIVVTPETVYGDISNQVTVVGNEADPVTGNNTDTASTTVIALPACPEPLTDLNIGGPSEGYINTLYSFTGIITPSTATEPITYTWSPAPDSRPGRASAAYQWSAAGLYSVTLEAENCGAELDASHFINVSAGAPAGDSYEPDDTCPQAQPIVTDGSTQDHTFHTSGDEDWSSFQAISGTTYLIEAVTPSFSTADVSLELHAACGTIPSETEDISFSPDVRFNFVAPSSGMYYLKSYNSQPDVAGPDVAYQLSVRSLAETATPGALVLVAGRLRIDDALQSNIHSVTNAVYNLFLTNGYTKDRIYYLATDLDLDPDADGIKDDVRAQANRTNLELAITNWATSASLDLGPDRAFTLFLMDHGGNNRFYLNGASQTVRPDELNGWLDTLESARPGVRVNIITEACHSGSFVDSLGGAGRVVIASTATHAVAYATNDGAVFSDAFLSALDRGLSLYGSFEEAQSVATTSHPDQLPWLDDDGNGVPNQGSDGLEAARRGFAYAGTFDPGTEKWPPYVVWAQARDVKDGRGIIEAEVQDDSPPVSFVWAVIYKPSYRPPDPSITEELPKEILPTVTLLDTDGDKVFSAVYEGFSEVGEYRIVVFATDDEELDARPKEIKVRTGWSVYLPLVIKGN